MLTREQVLKNLEDIVRFGGLTMSSEFVESVRIAMEAYENQHDWISVTERPPEESLNSVIGWDAYRERPVFVQYLDGHFCNMGSNESFDIRAWMPLPEPYTESEG